MIEELKQKITEYRRGVDTWTLHASEGHYTIRVACDDSIIGDVVGIRGTGGRPTVKYIHWSPDMVRWFAENEDCKPSPVLVSQVVTTSLITSSRTFVDLRFGDFAQAYAFLLRWKDVKR